MATCSWISIKNCMRVHLGRDLRSQGAEGVHIMSMTLSGAGCDALHCASRCSSFLPRPHRSNVQVVRYGHGSSLQVCEERCARNTLMDDFCLASSLLWIRVAFDGGLWSTLFPGGPRSTVFPGGPWSTGFISWGPQSACGVCPVVPLSPHLQYFFLLKGWGHKRK